MFELTIESPEETRQIKLDATERSRLLSDDLHAKGFSLNTRCGSRGLCDSCLVELRDGMDDIEFRRVDPEEQLAGLDGKLHRQFI